MWIFLRATEWHTIHREAGGEEHRVRDEKRERRETRESTICMPLEKERNGRRVIQRGLEVRRRKCRGVFSHPSVLGPDENIRATFAAHKSKPDFLKWKLFFPKSFLAVKYNMYTKSCTVSWLFFGVKRRENVGRGLGEGFESLRVWWINNKDTIRSWVLRFPVALPPWSFASEATTRRTFHTFYGIKFVILSRNDGHFVSYPNNSRFGT